MNTRSITLVYLVLCLILLAGCTGRQPTVEPYEDGYTTEIRENSQVEFQHLSLGVKKFQKVPCVDNPKKKCLSAVVWAVDFEQRDLGTPVRVQTGQVITEGNYTILIVEVGQDQKSGWIEVSILSSATPSPDDSTIFES